MMTMMKPLTYSDAQARMQPGDVIAFGGSSHFSGIVKMAIRAEVSHIGIVLHTQGRPSGNGQVGNYLMDSTSRQGVTVSRLDVRLHEYDGDVWWLPLRPDLRQDRFDLQAFWAFLREQDGKKYDVRQAAGSAIDLFDQLPFGWRGPGYNREDYTRFFCSELVAAGLKAAGVLPEALNTSEVTPSDLCRWTIYAPEYYLLKGNPLKMIIGYNTLDPSDWSG
jgi:hypothetical protein